MTPAAVRARKQNRKKILWGVVFLLALAAAAWFFAGRSRGDDALKNILTAQAFKTTLVETVSATGNVDAQTGAQINIGSQLTGTIKSLNADIGTKVTAGYVIAQLDLPDLNAQLAQSRAALAAAIAKLKQTVDGVPMERIQTHEAVHTAIDSLAGAIAHWKSAGAAATQQPPQTASDIQKAQAALEAAKASLMKAQNSHNQEIATAQAALNLAQANAINASTFLGREKKLFVSGFIAASDVDTAQTTAAVDAAQLNSARQGLDLAIASADNELTAAQQGVAQAKAALDSAKAEIYLNVAQAQNYKNAEAAVRQSESAYSSAKAGMAADILKDSDVIQARDAVTQALQNVKYEEAEVDKTYIRSPIAGTVIQLAMQQGETLAAGLSAPTLVVVADLNRLQVDAYVDETDIGKVKIGQSATVTVDAFPDRKISGRVFKIAAGSTLQQGVVTYDASIAIRDPDHLLLPGMTAAVTITVGEHPDVVAVPNEAIKPAKSGSSIWVLTKGGKEPEMVSVQTGATDGTYTEIISGVNDGDTVVLAGWPPPQIGNAPMSPFGAGARPGGGGGGGGGRPGGGGGR